MSTFINTSTARYVISLRFPIGVATIYRVLIASVYTGGAEGTRELTSISTWY